MGFMQSINDKFAQMQDEKFLKNFFNNEINRHHETYDIEAMLKRLQFDKNKMEFYNRLKSLGKFDGFELDEYYRSEKACYAPQNLLKSLELSEDKNKYQIMSDILKQVEDTKRKGIKCTDKVIEPILASEFLTMLETLDYKAKFIADYFSIVRCSDMEKVFDILSKEQIQGIIQDIEDMTQDKAYYIQGRLEDEKFREKYDAKIGKQLQESKAVPRGEESYKRSILNHYRDTMNFANLNMYIGSISDVDARIDETQKSVYRCEDDTLKKATLLNTILEVDENRDINGQMRISSFVVENYAGIVNEQSNVLTKMLESIQQVDGVTEEEKARNATSYNMQTSIRIQELLNIYLELIDTSGNKVKNLDFIIDYIPKDKRMEFIQSHRDTIDSETLAIVQNKIKREEIDEVISGRTEEEIINEIKKSSLPLDSIKEIIQNYINGIQNKVNITQTYIDQLSSHDIEEIRKSCNPNDAINNKEMIEKLAVLIHLKKQQEEARKGKSTELSTEKADTLEAPDSEQR